MKEHREAATLRDRFGGYDVLGVLGKGGMGEVYRARDRRLGREVALKVLPRRFALDGERRARFEQEARVLASLNHANIATLYGIEEADGVQALVLELVDGRTLEERLSAARARGGALPLPEALAIAREIAAALDAAHEHGVVHRDLKPSNIALASDGTVKLLDFGIAKALAPDRPAVDAELPTMLLTEMDAGRLPPGTAAYMSPEQARGERLDAGADIWAFGCILYEMLTGRRTFARGTSSETLARVLEGEPDLSLLPPSTPPLVARLVRRCLEKNRRERLRHIGDARADLADALAAPTPEGAAQSVWARPPMAWLAAGVIAAIAVAAVLAMRPPAAEPVVRVVRTTIPAEGSQSASLVFRNIALTHDGARLVYVGDDAHRIFVRPLDALEAEPIVSVTEGSDVRDVAVSPDDQWIAYVDTSFLLRRVSITGGPPRTLATLEGPSRGTSWAADDAIVFGTAAAGAGLVRIPADGGSATVLTLPDPEQGERNHWWPDVLPDGNAVLFTIMATSGDINDSRVAVLDLASGETRTLVRGAQDGRYASSGHLVYATNGSLRAVEFDAQRLAVTGTPITIAPRVAVSNPGNAAFALSGDGTLVYVEPPPESAAARTLVWVDRSGAETPLPAPPRPYLNPRISPANETRIALRIGDDLWVGDVGRTFVQLTFTPLTNWMPLWMPDGERLVYGSWRGGGLSNLYMQSADGTGPVRRLTESPQMHMPSAVTADGSAVLFTQVSARGWDLYLVPLDSLEPVPLLVTARTARNAVVSSDLAWVAYESDTPNAPGRMEIFVRPFPVTEDGGLWQVSSGGGTHPLWSADGEELFYLDAEGAMVAVAVETSGNRWIGGPQARLFRGPYLIREATVSRQYDVTADGQRFLMIREGEGAGEPLRIVLVQQWAEELRR